MHPRELQHTSTSSQSKCGGAPDVSLVTLLVRDSTRSIALFAQMPHATAYNLVYFSFPHQPIFFQQ